MELTGNHLRGTMELTGKEEQYFPFSVHEELATMETDALLARANSRDAMLRGLSRTCSEGNMLRSVTLARCGSTGEQQHFMTEPSLHPPDLDPLPEPSHFNNTNSGWMSKELPLLIHSSSSSTNTTSSSTSPERSPLPQKRASFFPGNMLPLESSLPPETSLKRSTKPQFPLASTIPAGGKAAAIKVERVVKQEDQYQASLALSDEDDTEDSVTVPTTTSGTRGGAAMATLKAAAANSLAATRPRRNIRKIVYKDEPDLDGLDSSTETDKSRSQSDIDDDISPSPSTEKTSKGSVKKRQGGVPPGKRERNKISAANYRKRRKMYIGSLETDIASLKSKLSGLKYENLRLKSEGNQLRDRVKELEDLLAPKMFTGSSEVPYGEGASSVKSKKGHVMFALFSCVLIFLPTLLGLGGLGVGSGVGAPATSQNLSWGSFGWPWSFDSTADRLDAFGFEIPARGHAGGRTLLQCSPDD